MADVKFGQLQETFAGNPADQWARLIIYQDEYADCLASASPFMFEITSTNRSIGKIPVGISDYDAAGTTDADFDAHKEIIKRLLADELQNVDVVLYTTATRFKEAFCNDFQGTLQLNSKIIKREEVLWWSYCGKNNKVLLVAVEDLEDYGECMQYLEDQVL